MEIVQYAIFWADFNPTIGSEISRIRSCIIISPNEMNFHLRTVIIAPVTHTIKPYPTRIRCSVKGESGAIMLDQIRTLDKRRLTGFIETLAEAEIEQVKLIIKEMFC